MLLQQQQKKIIYIIIFFPYFHIIYRLINNDEAIAVYVCVCVCNIATERNRTIDKKRMDGCAWRIRTYTVNENRLMMIMMVSE